MNGLIAGFPYGGVVTSQPSDTQPRIYSRRPSGARCAALRQRQDLPFRQRFRRRFRDPRQWADLQRGFNNSDTPRNCAKTAKKRLPKKCPGRSAPMIPPRHKPPKKQNSGSSPETGLIQPGHRRGCPLPVSDGTRLNARADTALGRPVPSGCPHRALATRSHRPWTSPTAPRQPVPARRSSCHCRLRPWDTPA